jgi:hypothetical protein
MDESAPEKPKRKRDHEGQFAKGNDGGPFKKGVSGNPGGRKGDPRDREDYQKLAKRYSLVALRRLFRLMEDAATDPEVRRKCAVNLLDRAWGKPTESVELNASGQSLVTVVVPGTIADPDLWAERTRQIDESRRVPMIEHKGKPNGEAIR